MLLLAGALVAAPPVLQPVSSTARCPRARSYVADTGGIFPGKPLTPQKLTEIPDANLYSAVYRRIAGCEIPIVVRYRVSGR